MTENRKQQLHAHITGRVQGVAFRYHTRQAAQNHNLTGWVRNCRDGSVEVLAEGELDHLNQLLAVLRQGPPSAVVDHVDYAFSDATGEFNQFRVRMTA